ncbi:MAG: DUF697 domain-containing protein [Planctomycetaceae bacterium]|nr:DUF697 domain-containing protein [Planctomycetaceae bacterium]
MVSRRRYSKFMLILVLACIGFLMVYLPTAAMRQYQSAKELGSIWGTIYLLFVSAGGLMMAAASGWVVWRLWDASRRKRKRIAQRQRNPSEMSLSEREAEVAQNISAVAEMRDAATTSDELRGELSPLIRWIEEKQDEQKLEIVAFGTVSSGKSSLLNALAGRDVFEMDLKGGTTVQRNEIPWPGMDQITLVDTPGLGEVDGSSRQHLAAEAAKDADLVLVVVDGPLRDSEFQLLQTLADMEKRVVVCLNKEDWYSESDRDALLGQIRRQVNDFVEPLDVLAVRSRPTLRDRVRVLPDGAEVEEEVEVPADIQSLAQRMIKIVKRDGSDLLLANLLLQSRGLVDEAKERVRESLDRRAWQIVDKYMWGAAGAAALSPFPMVDLAAGCAISTKMVVDLARVYKQDIDVDVAMNLLGQQGKTLLGVLGSSVATPVIASSIASMIKSVPGVGTIAGGVLQGGVQALIARWIGAIFIRYFRDEMKTPAGGMAELARQEWERVTSVNEIRRLVTAARRHFQDDDQDFELGPPQGNQ